MKKVSFLSISAAVTTLLLLLFPNTAREGAVFGLRLWAEKLLPTMLPFSAAIGMMSYSGVFNIITEKTKRTAEKIGIPPPFFCSFVSGIIAGFPTGAIAVAEAVSEKKELTQMGKRALWYTSFVSPTFVLATVGGSLGIRYALLVLAADYISFFAVFLLIERKKPFDYCIEDNNADAEKKSFGKMLSGSLKKAISGALTVGGCTVMFSVWLEFANCLPVVNEIPIAGAIIGLLFELSNGIEATLSLEIPICVTVTLSAFGTAWGGLSVNSQILGIADFSEGKSLLPLNLLHGLTASLVSFILTALFG